MGMISYSFYLLQVPIGMRVINLGARFVNGYWSGLLLFWLAFAVTIFVSWLFYILIERPSHRWSRKVALKGNNNEGN